MAASCGLWRRDLGDDLTRLRASCVVIVLDAAAAKHVGAYGYPRATTPNIDTLAAGGVLFTRAYSQGASTVVSVPSFMTGLYPRSLTRLRAAHGAAPPIPLIPAGSTPLLAQGFRAAGFRTGGFVENPIVGRTLGVDRGFDEFVEVDPVRAAGLGSQQVVDRALGWIRANRESRFFAYIHLLRPHGPYLPPAQYALRFRPPGYRGTLVADARTLAAADSGALRASPEDVEFLVSQYDANLRYGDWLVGEIVDELQALGVLARTVVVVTADHGEAFGEHGRFQHNSTLYEEMVRVPLVFSFPVAVEVAPKRIDVPVGLVDLLPTLADLFALPAEPSRRLDGLSLVPLIDGWRRRWPREIVYAQRAGSVAAIERDFAYIGGGGPAAPTAEELYDLEEDPRQQRNVTAVHPERTDALRTAVQAFLAGTHDVGELQTVVDALAPEKRDQLRAIGYLD